MESPIRYDFDVFHSHSRLWSIGGDVHFRVTLRRSDAEPARSEFESLATTLLMLGATGALCGLDITPNTSLIGDRDLVWCSGAELFGCFRGCVVDDLTTVILANLFSLAHAQHPIVRVRVGADSRLADATETLRHDPYCLDPYPGLYSQPPFPCSLEEGLDEPTLNLEFVRELSDDQKTLVESEILTWGAACSRGTFSGFASDPSDSFVLVDPAAFEWVGKEMAFHLTKFRAHDAALRSLANLCCALHGKHIEIRSLSVE